MKDNRCRERSAAAADAVAAAKAVFAWICAQTLCACTLQPCCCRWLLLQLLHSLLLLPLLSCPTLSLEHAKVPVCASTAVMLHDYRLKSAYALSCAVQNMLMCAVVGERR